jgi:hypothetical protein
MESSPPSINGTLGSGEIGLVLATFLYGIETLQTFNYYHDCTKDVVFLRILVRSPAPWLQLGSDTWPSGGEHLVSLARRCRQSTQDRRFLELAHLICGCHAVDQDTQFELLF